MLLNLYNYSRLAIMGFSSNLKEVINWKINITVKSITKVRGKNKFKPGYIIILVMLSCCYMFITSKLQESTARMGQVQCSITMQTFKKASFCSWCLLMSCWMYATLSSMAAALSVLHQSSSRRYSRSRLSNTEHTCIDTHNYRWRQVTVNYLLISYWSTVENHQHASWSIAKWSYS